MPTFSHLGTTKLTKSEFGGHVSTAVSTASVQHPGAEGDGGVGGGAGDGGDFGGDGG